VPRPGVRQPEASPPATAGWEVSPPPIRATFGSRSPALRGLSERARSRLDHVLPALLEAAAHSAAPDAALSRGIGLLQAIVRRSSYLALLEERPAALARLVDVIARSALLAERLVAHPLLLDELLESGIEPFATMYHWDLPQALQDRHGGWMSRDTSKAFADYAGYVAERLSDRVKHIFTINECSRLVHLGYGVGADAPGASA